MWWISLVIAEESTPLVDTVEIGELEQQIERIESLQFRVQKLEEEISMQSDFAQQDAEIVNHLSLLVDSRQTEELRIQAVERLAQMLVSAGPISCAQSSRKSSGYTVPF